MLLIPKNTTATYILTLTEKVTLAVPYFLFEFRSDVTNVPVYFISANTSLHTDRYDSFVITETTGSINYTSGTIALNPTGQWTYRVWEQTSTTNLNPVNTTTLLETGILKVTGTSEVFYSNSGVDNTFIVDE